MSFFFVNIYNLYLIHNIFYKIIYYKIYFFHFTI